MTTRSRDMGQLVLVISAIFSHAFLLVRSMKLDRISFCPEGNQFIKPSKCPTKISQRQHAKSGPGASFALSIEREQRSDASRSQVCTIQGSRLPNIDSILGSYYKIAFAITSCLIVKYTIICLLGSNQRLKQFGYVACYLPGRVMVNARVVGFTNYVVLFVLCFMLIWRIVLLIVKPKFNLHFIEFMMYDRDEVTNHMLKNSNAQLASCKTVSEQAEFHHILHHLDLFNQTGARPGQTNQSLPRFTLRFNRTVEARKSLIRNMIIFLAISYTWALVYVPIQIYVSLPLILTKFGFELTHSDCIEWIRSQPDPALHLSICPWLNSSDHIYTPATSKSAFIPFSNFIEFTPYHMMRIVFDVLENFIVYFDLFNAFTYPTVLAIMVATDSLNYSSEINRRLKFLIAKLLADERGSSNLLLNGQKSSTYTNTSRRDSEINCLQSAIVDQLGLIRSYNMFASFFIAFATSLWFTYSAIVCSWMFIPEAVADTNKLEWYVIQAMAASYTMAIFGSYSVLRRSSRQTYSLISSLTALDRSCAERKQRWLAIGKHYYPRPLYCFRLFGAIELSWLSHLKLITWHVAALFVASTFFTIAYRDASTVIEGKRK